MGKLQVNGDISATGTISASSFLGNASTSSIPLGFSYRETSWTWGTLTAANGYTLLTDWITPAAGGVAFADKGTQVSCQIDGYFYQDEGRYIVLDANNYTSYAPTKTGSGASGTWKINITGNAATASFASSASLLSIHNTVTNTSTRSVAASTWTGSVSGLKYVWGEAFKDTSIGSDTGDLVLGLRAGQYTSGGTELCMMIDGDYYSMGNKVLHAGNYNSYAPTKTGSGASGTWGINITGSADSANWASGASYAQRVAGAYTGNGGAQGPSYIGRGNVKFNMMNQFPNAGTTNYMDCILMNTYGGGDVPRATAFGIERYTGRAWIAEGSDTSSTWAQVYEVISTRNIGSQSVNYANTAGDADRVYPINSNPNNSHPGYGLKVFYSWDQGQVGNDNGGYANGITIGSHPGDQAYGFQIVQNMWNDRTYTRRYNQGWQSWKTLAWTDDLAAYLPLSGGTMTGHLYATSGLSWNNSYWTPNGNIYCQPTGNGQEWSFDVGASGYTGCYWHVWSAKNGCSMLRCDADNNAVGIPNGPLYLGSSCYGPNLPGASYVGQIFFKT